MPAASSAPQGVVAPTPDFRGIGADVKHSLWLAAFLRRKACPAQVTMSPTGFPKGMTKKANLGDAVWVKVERAAVFFCGGRVPVPRVSRYDTAGMAGR